MTSNTQRQWNDENYPALCGSRKGICPKCGENWYLTPTLIDKDNFVVREYCQFCGELIHCL